MKIFEKTQHLIDPGDCVRRQHAIPENIRKFAGMAQIEFSGTRMRGRVNVPTLADIYYQLAKEGYELVEAGANPTFTELGQPDGVTFVQIKFESDFDTQLRKLKASADDGDYVVMPYKEISLISLAVTLMQVAIDERAKQLQKTAKKAISNVK